MTDTRLQPGDILPAVERHLVALDSSIERAAADAGLPPTLLDLIRLRVSQLNGCAFCVDMHSRDARKGGETERRVFLVSAWPESRLYSDTERAALALAEAMTRLPDTRDVPDDVYEQATKALTDEQFAVIAWAVTCINAWNRMGVLGRMELPADPSQ